MIYSLFLAKLIWLCELQWRPIWVQLEERCTLLSENKIKKQKQKQKQLLEIFSIYKIKYKTKKI